MTRVFSIRMAISAMLKMVVTSSTEMMMHSRVIRFWRFRTLAEIGIRLR